MFLPVVRSAQALAECLVGTPLAGRDVTTHEMAQSGDLLLAVKIEEAELVPAWSAARAIVDRTGRWPAVGGNIYPAPSIDVSPLESCFEHERPKSGQDC
jgi:hypothetical protein